jgi:hypothetical protein
LWLRIGPRAGSCTQYNKLPGWEHFCFLGYNVVESVQNWLKFWRCTTAVNLSHATSQPGSDPRSRYMGFVVDKVALGQVSWAVRFPLPISFHYSQLSLPITWGWYNMPNSGWCTSGLNSLNTKIN